MNPKYEKIIDIPHHEPMNHPRMPKYKRAAQFAPFDALAGYDEAIIETGRETEEKILLTEDMKQSINGKLNYLLEHISEKPEIRITYFVADSRKEGGSYLTDVSRVKKVDDFTSKLILEDNVTVGFDDIYQIEIMK